jgi:hypothetical protein
MIDDERDVTRNARVNAHAHGVCVLCTIQQLAHANTGRAQRVTTPTCALGRILEHPARLHGSRGLLAAVIRVEVVVECELHHACRVQGQ